MTSDIINHCYKWDNMFDSLVMLLSLTIRLQVLKKELKTD